MEFLMSGKKLISIVIPAYNEEDVVDELKKRLQMMMDGNPRYDFEVIIIENGSFDSTYDKLLKTHAEDNRFKILQLSRNFQCDGGITAGLHYALGDAAVIMMADLQDPPELVPQFLEKWEEGYDIVYTVVVKRIGVGLTRRFLSRLFYKIFGLLTNWTIPENASDFKLVDKKVYETINQMDERKRMLRGMITWTGFKQYAIEFERPPRFAGESKAIFKDVFNLALDGIFSFSKVPLQIATLLGFVVSILSFLMIIIELVLFILYGRVVPGFTTLIITILFLFGMMFIVLGIIGEYIARIYDEVKQRPNYIVKREIGF
jgi:polyisoprenyl-phosphate glycosyltransferase